MGLCCGLCSLGQALSVLFQQLNKAAGADKAKSASFAFFSTPNLRALVVWVIAVWEKTAMKPHIEYFEKFVRGLNAGRAKAKQEGVTEGTSFSVDLHELLIFSCASPSRVRFPFAAADDW